MRLFTASIFLLLFIGADCEGQTPRIVVPIAQPYESALSAEPEAVVDPGVIDEADDGTIAELAQLDGLAECKIGESIMDNERKPRRGWVCCDNRGGCVMMPVRVQRGLDAAYMKRKAREK